MMKRLALLVLVVAPALAWAQAQRVTVGVHLRNAEAVSLEQNAYSLSFVMWMRWKGELDPTKSFRFVNLLEAWALTSTPVYEEPLVEADGSRYQRFVVEGRFFHKFDLGPYPLDWQKLVLELEDVRHDALALTYVADEQSSVVEPLAVPGWTPVARILEVVPFSYPGGLGQADAKPFSRFRFGVKLQRPLRLLLLTMAPPVLLVLLCCFAVFFLRPLHVEARVGTVITALLTVVFLQLAFTDDLPYLGNSVLLDQLFNLSYVLMTAVLLECVVVTRLFDRAKDLEAQAATQDGEARAATKAQADAALQRIARLDRWAARGFPPLYALGCLVIVLVARGAQVTQVPF